MKQLIGFLRLKEIYFLVRREVLYNILTEFAYLHDKGKDK